MKRASLTAIAAATAFALAGCGSSGDDDKGAEAVNTTSTAPTTAPTTVSTTTETVTTSEDAPAPSADEGDVNQTEVDEWTKSIVGLGTTDQFVDAATNAASPDWAASIIAVTVSNGELHMETNLEAIEPAEEMANRYAQELRDNPPHDWAKSITKVVVGHSDGPTLVEAQV